jgi:hypothetical protein
MQWIELFATSVTQPGATQALRRAAMSAAAGSDDTRLRAALGTVYGLPAFMLCDALDRHDVPVSPEAAQLALQWPGTLAAIARKTAPAR